jgi:hypothetical protein
MTYTCYVLQEGPRSRPCRRNKLPRIRRPPCGGPGGTRLLTRTRHPLVCTLRVPPLCTSSKQVLPGRAAGQTVGTGRNVNTQLNSNHACGAYMQGCQLALASWSLRCIAHAATDGQLQHAAKPALGEVTGSCGMHSGQQGMLGSHLGKPLSSCRCTGEGRACWGSHWEVAACIWASRACWRS